MSKKVIIVSPHFPPSNLAAVHRSRLFAKHLASFGWEPIVVTVDESYYEESLDPNLAKLMDPKLRIIKAKALKTKPIRFIGDIGIRGFKDMYRKIVALSKVEKIDFLYIPIPSNFAALLGPLVHAKTGIPYGIDYIDPWVHHWPGTEKVGSKHWFSMKLGEWLEPIAVRKASLITGVAPGYYEAVLERNPHLKSTAVTAAMPYGGEKDDHNQIEHLQLAPYLFQKEAVKIDLVYAGAMLPKAVGPLEAIFKNIQQNRSAFENVRFHFIGSGKHPNDPFGFNTKALAEQYGLWQSIVFEYPKRIPYLDVLVHLNQADGIFILGSTEPHYTPSKTYQGVLSGKPILALLHEASSACEVLTSSLAGVLMTIQGENDLAKIEDHFHESFASWKSFAQTFHPDQVKKEAFEAYSAFEVTRILAKALDKAVEK